MVFRRFETGAVNRAVEVMDGLGGKALNVARVLAQLGVPSLAMGFAGGERGAWMKAELDRANVEHEIIDIKGETRLCTTIVDESTRVVTELVEESSPTEAEDYERLFLAVERRIPTARAFVLSGTLTPGAPVDFYARCTALARRRGVMAIVDAHSRALEAALAEGPDVVKPNRAELERTAGRTLTNDEQVWDAMGALQQKGARGIVVTDGSLAVFAAREKKRWKITPPKVEALNPIGSGDAFTAAMTAELVRGASFGQACMAGAAAGAANALTWMPGTVEGARYRELLGRCGLKSCSILWEYAKRRPRFRGRPPTIPQH
jgi:tagatose 6-phosphate kinase